MRISYFRLDAHYEKHFSGYYFFYFVIYQLLFSSKRANKAVIAHVTASTADTLSITHAAGVTQIHKNPQRVILFDFGTYDSLEKLGLTSHVVGLPKSIPSYIKGKVSSSMTEVGGMKDPDLNAIALLQPDLIIITGRPRQFI
ncbi:Uncharacterized ABC transporter solute-binding protein yclQ precursor [Hafnia alvei]|uniref:Uncharacterized ABC transporter solute-binding protein yclQ n=1 Tax=Hafnia alvei TaxID=569 RepID=A0A377PDW9_HAFAL|nr:Uncharacterized ABC transporter solute-binding protein yclQ precursor [Hafnia alvei]